jgi:membrane fusion protein
MLLAYQQTAVSAMTEFRMFRPEAIAYQRDPLRANEAFPIPPTPATLTWLLAALLGTGIAFLACGDYARKETVSGFLAPTAGVSKVFPPRGGLIIAVDVSEGQVVEAGTPLLTVQIGQNDGQGSDVDSAVLRTLSRQRTAVVEQMELQKKQAAQDENRLRDRLEGLGHEITSLLAQLALQRARSQVAEEQVTAVGGLVRQGYVSVIEFERRQDNFLLQKQTEAALGAQLAEKQDEATQERDALNELPGQLATKLSTLRGSEAQLEGRLAEIAGRHAYQIRAPVPGRVSALQARVGFMADPAIPQLAIVPSQSVLEAQLLVPARAIGFVTAGQTVQLAYNAYPYQRFGLHRGQVLTVSRTLLRPSELIGPVAADYPAYLVTVAIARQTVTAAGRSFPLRADMTLKADIVFDRRSLLKWVLDPMLSLHGRAV